MIQSLLDRWRRGQSASANVIACGYFWSCIGQLESRSSVREYQSYGSTCPNRQRGYLVFAEVRTNHFGFVDSWAPRSYGVFSCVEGGSVTPFVGIYLSPIKGYRNTMGAVVTVASDAGQAVAITEPTSGNTFKHNILQSVPLPSEQLLDALPLVPEFSIHGGARTFM